jgi:hypothetical protein
MGVAGSADKLIRAASTDSRVMNAFRNCSMRVLCLNYVIM